MLVYFNDILSSGQVPDLYNQEDKDNIINAIRPEVKNAGVMDSTENCWDYFIDKARACFILGTTSIIIAGTTSLTRRALDF